MQLQNLYRKLKEQPSSMTVVQPTDYTSYIETYREKAADVHVQRGLTYMEEGEKAAFRKAYVSFKNALSYKPGDTDIRGKMVAAYDRAVVNVVVLPLDDFGSGRYSYGASYGLRNFEDELVRNLRHNTNNEFIKFYAGVEARQRDIQPDEILELRLGRMEIGRPYDKSQTHTSSKNVVVKETVYKPDSVVKEYATITAQVTTTRRTLLSTGELYVTARNAKGTPLWNDVFRGEHRWQVEFATYRGDERALTDNDRALINKQPDRQTPREDEINEAVLRQIENDLHSRIRQQYNRYY